MKKMKNSTIPIPDESFGEYFDNQRLRLEDLIKDKNRQLNLEWKEDYEKRKGMNEEKEDRETQV